jgi:hypothetical protein
MSYKLKPSEEDPRVEILHKNGVQCICPFTAPVLIPYQNALGQVVPNVVRMPCSSQCALFDIKEDSSIDGAALTHVEVSLHCNANDDTKNIRVELEADLMPAKPSPFTIH